LGGVGGGVGSLDEVGLEGGAAGRALRLPHPPEGPEVGITLSGLAGSPVDVVCADIMQERYPRLRECDQDAIRLRQLKRPEIFELPFEFMGP
jgi:hypothetical protein